MRAAATAPRCDGTVRAHERGTAFYREGTITTGTRMYTYAEKHMQLENMQDHHSMLHRTGQWEITPIYRYLHIFPLEGIGQAFPEVFCFVLDICRV